MNNEKEMQLVIKRQEEYVDAVVVQLLDWVDSFGNNAVLTQDVGDYRTWRTEIGNVFEYYKVYEEEPSVVIEEDDCDEDTDDYDGGVSFCVAVVFSKLNDSERQEVFHAMLGDENVIIMPTEGVALLCSRSDIGCVTEFKLGDTILSDILDRFELQLPEYRN